MAINKVYTSYFYQVRNFKPNCLGFSTAIWPPKYFHAGNPSLDKNGVLVGLTAPPFAPGPLCEGDCHGPKECTSKPNDCAFLKHYRQQLDQLDIKEIMAQFERIAAAVQEDYKFKGEPQIILIVYEAPSNQCSERTVIQQWFRDNGVECEEWSNS